MSDIDDPLDESFAQQLANLEPAPFQSGLESTLYEAGYRAGVESQSNRSPAILGRWAPAVAASLLTAIVTLSFSFRQDKPTVDRTAGNLAEQSITRPDPNGRLNQPQTVAIDPAADSTTDTESSNELQEHFRIGPPEFNWQLTSTSPLKTSSLPMVYQSRASDPLPQSTWLAMDDESFPQPETLSLRDFATASATLGL